MIKKIIIVILGCLLIGILSFYIIVLRGGSPKLQEIWVTTAMNTDEHQYLATYFIDSEKIEEIMARVYVDDSAYSTDTSLIDKGEEVPGKPAGVQIAVDLINKAKEKEQAKVDGQVNEKDEVVEYVEYEDYIGHIGAEKKSNYVEEGYVEKSEGVWYKEVGGIGWKGYLLLVEDASRVSLAQTRYQYERGDLVKTMVTTHDALFGINGGGFNDGPNYDSNGGVPAGLVVTNGEIIQAYDTNHMIGFNEDDILVLGDVSKEELVEMKIRDAVEFRPYLIVNGEGTIKNGDGGWGIAPRTAIGQRATGEVLFLCIDGRQVHSIGCDLKPVQDTLLEEKCLNAALLDGGSSTVMYSKEEGYLNKPSLGHERYINNSWIIK